MTAPKEGPRKTITSTRDEQLIRAAKTRAAITAFFKNTTDKVTKSQIEQALVEDLKTIGCDTHAFAYLLKDMVRVGLISSDKATGDSKPVFFANDGSKPAKPANTLVKVATKPQQQTQTAHPVAQPNQHLVIDVVRTTGRVRISTPGMTIEIGIVNE